MSRSSSSFYSVLFVVGAVGLIGVAYLLYSGSDPGQLDERVRGVTRAIVGTERKECGELFRQCTAVAEIKVPDCEEDSARRRAQEAIGVAVENPGCTAAAKELVESCPDGCRFDFQGMVSVPGALALDFNEDPDEAGYCHAQAKMPFTLRGSCVRK